MNYQHILNGRLVSEEQLLISPRDVGFSRGYAVFDFLRTYRGIPFKLWAHIERLYASAEHIGLVLPWQKEEIVDQVQQVLAVNNDGQEKFLKIIVSGGLSHSMLPGATPTFMILVDPATVYPEERYTKGIHVITVQHDRYLPHAKTNNYIEGMKQCQIGACIQAEEPVYYSEQQVFEGSNSNIFAVIDGVLYTPKTNVLHGITRDTLLEILDLDLPLRHENFTRAQLDQATEVFLTGSGKEITPVTKIDERPVHDGQVGPWTKEVMKQFRAYTDSDAWVGL